MRSWLQKHRDLCANNWQIYQQRSKTFTLGNADGETTVGAAWVC
jgi:hypothetical protein